MSGKTTLVLIAAITTVLFLNGPSRAFNEVDLAKLKETKACSHCDLREATLSGLDLSGAKLSYANLSGADLSNADLSEANLSGAKLIFAILRGANLKGANLNDARLAEADLSEATWTDGRKCAMGSKGKCR